MATTQTSDTGGTNAAIIILAVIIIAAIAVGAVWYMNTNGASTSSNNSTTERYVSKVEQVPAQVGQAAKDATAPTANPPSQDTAPATGASDAPVPNQTPAQ